MEKMNFQARFQKIQESPPEIQVAALRFQDYVPKIIKDYQIKPPQTFRLWKLAKKNLGYIETVVGALEQNMEGTKPENAGLLISKLFPKRNEHRRHHHF